ncbi:MAG: hypothetical protein JXQ72_16110 [Anaerolineae bacterium]|nr:hypothetical protein [Anaerolineae bacterium]
MPDNYYMPNVDVLPQEDLAALFEKARQMCSEQKDGFLKRLVSKQARYVSLITPGRIIAHIDCPAQGSIDEEHISTIKKILPPDPPGYVASIAFNDLKTLMGANQRLDMANIAPVIPFMGYLMGFSYIGHSVVVFEGHPSAFATGIKGAHLLLIDARMADHLQPDWLDVAYDAMHTPKIFLYHVGGAVQQVVKTPPPPNA